MIGSLLRIRYEIVQELEESVLFHSFRAKDRVGSREVKVRLIHAPFGQEAEFLAAIREVISRNAAMLHPDLERLYELDDHEGTPFLISDLPQGSVLQERIRKLAPFSAPISISIALGVLEALTSLHSFGEAHGDISSANIYATQEGKVKVALAGMWRAYARSKTAGAVVLPGMAPYLAPEVTQGMMPSPASDVYAIGALLVELLTGRYPFSADTAVAMAMKHATAPVPSPRIVNPAVPAVLEEVIKKAMAKAPSDRYSDAPAMIRDLRILQDGLRFGRNVSWPISPTEPTPESVAEPKAQLVAPRMSAIRTEKERKSREEESADLGDRIPRWLQAMGYLSILAMVVAICSYAYWNFTNPKELKLPNLAGMNQMEAGKQLEKLKLKQKVEFRESDRPQGTVLGSDPPAGSLIKEGKTVHLRVVAESKNVEVPDLRGRTELDARDLLHQLKLKGDPITPVPSRDFEKGIVVRQLPKPKEQISRGSSVHLFVSNGKTEGVSTEYGPLRTYHIKFALNTPDRVRVRIDMIDELDSKTVFEEDHLPGEIIETDQDARGKKVTFKIFYNGQLVSTKEVTSDEGKPIKGADEER